MLINDLIELNERGSLYARGIYLGHITSWAKIFVENDCVFSLYDKHKKYRVVFSTEPQIYVYVENMDYDDEHPARITIKLSEIKNNLYGVIQEKLKEIK